MADTTETIKFDNDVLSNGQGGTLTVTGYAVVDYSNGSFNVYATFTFPNGGGSADEQEYKGAGSLLSSTANGVTTYSIDPGETFSFTYNGQAPLAANSMTFTGVTPNYSAGGAPLSSTPGGTVMMLCFVTGTRIRTVRGDIAVEALQVGDLAVTASGAHRPIAWIGHKEVGGTRGVRADARPVRISAGAFGAGLPERELWLSPGHPVLVGADEDGEGGHLVPIMCLVNGTTIERMPVERVTYWHVELDAHDILLAEGLPAESYLDWGDRAFFTEAADHALANPDFVVPGLGGRCRPVAVDGPAVAAERRRLDAVFATQLVGACAWPMTEDAAVLG